MARVTVEDCLVHVPDRFELVVLAAHRARLIGSGSLSLLPRERDKDAVLALREVAEAVIPIAELRQGVIESCSLSSAEEPGDGLSSAQGTFRRLTHAEIEEDEWVADTVRDVFDPTSLIGGFDM